MARCHGARDLDAAPLVSIVVPSRCMARTLEGTLESILGQTWPHVELIVQDSCSRDGSAEVLAAYASRIDALHVEPDGGQSDALRRGFARAHGEILGWLNADDLLMPDAVERAVAAFVGRDRPDVVYGHCAFLGADDQFLRYFHEIKPFSARRLLDDGNFVAQSSTFFRRSAYEAVGGLDAALHFTMDWDLWCRLAAAGHRFELVDHVLSAARMHPGTKTGGGGLRRWLEILRTNRRHRTSRLPRAAIAHFYSDLLGPHLTPDGRLARGLMPRLVDTEFLRDVPVCGLARDGRAVGRGFALRFPLRRRVKGLRLRLSCAAEAPSTSLEVTSGGRRLEARAGAVSDGRLGWIAEERTEGDLAAVEIEVRPRGPVRGLRFEGLALDLA